MAKLSQTFTSKSDSNTSTNTLSKKLSQTFSSTGGSNTAPSASGKLSETFTSNQSLGGGKLSDTFTANTPVTKSVPSVTAPSEPSIDYKAIIKEYEALPNTNIIARLVDKDLRDAYKRKQELNPLYEQAQDLFAQDLLKKYNLNLSDVQRHSGNTKAEAKRINKVYADKGITDKSELKALKNYAVRAQNNQVDKNLTEFADEHPVGGTILSGLLKTASDIPGYLQNKVDYLAGNPMSASKGANAMTQTYQNMRGAVSEDFGTVGKGAYEIGTSLMDMIPILATGGNGGLAWAGMSAEQNSIPSLINRGLTPNQIALTSMANGVAEAALEKIPLGNFEKWAKEPIEKSFKSIAKVIGSQFVSEGIEESGTEIANTIFDLLINQNKAEFAEAVEEKGFKNAFIDLMKQVGYAGLIGGLSGGVLGSGTAAANVAMNGFAAPEGNAAKTDVPGITSPNVNNAETQENTASAKPKLSDTFTSNNVNTQPTSADLTGENVQATNTPLEQTRRKQRLVANENIDEDYDLEDDDFDSYPDGDRYSWEPNEEDDDDYWIGADLERDEDELTMEIGGLVPTIRDENGTTSRVATNSYAKFFEYDEEGLNHLIDNIEDGQYQKQVKGMKETYDNAIREIEKYTPESKFDDLMKKGVHTDDDIALGHNLLKYYSEIGDVGKVDALLLQIQKGGTDLGRALHYFKIFGDSPLGVQQATNALVGSKIKEFENDVKKNKNGKKAKQLKQIEEITKTFEELTKEQSEAEPSERRQNKRRNRRTKAEAEKKPLNNKLAKALNQLRYGKKENTRVQLTHDEIRERVVNTLEKLAPFKKFTEQQIDIITNYVETSRVSVDTLAQEMKSVLATDEFFNVDESTPLPKQKGNAKFQSALKLLTEGRTETEAKEKTPAEIRREIEATLGADVDSFSDLGIEFLTMLVADPKISNEVIADELAHYMKTGEFYTLDEGIEPTKPISGKLQSILNEMGADTEVVEKKPKTYEEIREEVKNTFAKEMASIDFTDDEISYFARLLHNNVDRADIQTALLRKITTGYMNMSEEDIKAINSYYEQADKARTSKESLEFKKKAAEVASKYLGPVSWMEKINAWRYLAMLGNPRTIIRNKVGNITFGAVTDAKDAIGAMLEKAFVKKGKRTKAILNPVEDADLIKACAEDFNDVAYESATEGGNKYNMKSEIENARKVFNNKYLEKYRTLTNNVLEGDDIKALRAKYKKALAGYLKANGYDASVLKTNNSILEDARAYAIEQAKIATFHAENNFANLLQKMSDKARESGGVSGKVLETIVESLAPFKKTPANILQQGFEYSPLGMLKLVSQIKSQAGASAYIDTISKSLTGVGLMALGAWLKSMGILVGQRDDEDDPYGKGQNYALKIGNHTYTIDWAAPAALPLFVGGELYDSWTTDGTAEETKDFFESLSSISEPMVEMSMLQGLSNTLDALVNTKKSKLSTTAANIATGYASQMVPTVLGQVARTIDPNRRSTRTNTSSYKQPVLATLEKAGEKTVNKIPGLSMTNEKYIDIWGEEQKNTGGNLLGRAVQNFVSPGYWNDVSMTEREEKLADLEKTFKENGYKGSLIPSIADSNKPDGTRMSNKEFEKWAKTRGKELGEAVDTALKYENKTTTKELQGYVKQLENFANFVAEKKEFNTDVSDTYKKAYEAYKVGGYDGAMYYYMMNDQADTDGNGSVTQEELAKWMRKSGVPASDREKYFKIKFPKAKEIPSLR